jgi:hypothetical protein
MSTGDIAALKSAYRIPAAWRDLALPGEPGKSCHSPFREDRKPSFSIYADGLRWSDFATGESGDVLDFVAKARTCDIAAAIAFVRERLGIVDEYDSPVARPRRWPELGTSRRGLDALVRQRGFNPAAMRMAEERGYLRFGALWGYNFWAITDCRRAMIERRRTTGDPWPAFRRLPERKAHCLGAGKDWPIGILEAESFQIVALCEGAPDFLALLSLAHGEGKADRVGPLAMLGAGTARIAPDALPFFRDKHVRIFPHVDAAGEKALRRWARQIRDAGAARVDAFDLSGVVRDDGVPGKDLADLCRIDPDCFEKHPKFREVLP